ncbi:thioesterase II family protein [Streptomyces sp. SBT349]|uniref:thioesterase II family protein n=1 Tax=Streptomyces sp. SBT349 TaxID=1580539 RepID=UPI00066A3C1C|nr:alpha/beta fold hydrolase [Streptomyces sp. SBT349]
MTFAQDTSAQWIRGFGKEFDGGRVRLVCFPHAGGAASFYYPLAGRLGGEGGVAEVRAVQYPGRQDRRREAPLTTIEALASRAVEEVRRLNDKPLVLFGHSMGAVIAYEVARRLERESGPRPLGLIASGRRAPSVHIPDDVHRRGDGELIDALRELSGTASSLLDDEEVLRMILPALRADYRAVESYRHRPGPELACPVTALVGVDDGRAPLEQMRPWRRHTTGAFDLRVFPGGHFYLTEQWTAVADAIRASVGAFEEAAGLTVGGGAQASPPPA